MSIDQRPSYPREADTTTETLVESCFVPQRYEPNYPYPLLVMFHNRGADEQQMERRLPAMSWRNYVGLSLRGPETVLKKGKFMGFGWGSEFSRRERDRPSIELTQSTQAAIVHRHLFENQPDAIDRLEDAVFTSVKQTRRSLHIHSERIFLVGYGEGAAVAYRLGLTYPERFAGVVAINGWIPGGFRPLSRIHDCRKLKVLVVHGEWNDRVRIEDVRKEVGVLRAAGIKVAFQSYPCAHRLTTPMLADVDGWIINQCTANG